ncbi:MAG: glycosyltransferase family 2 protein [Candidatus Aminicenantes bacterium]|nr:glycosyltransferase family 2 protein [Candidatus Aminicenantes bacterium]
MKKKKLVVILPALNEEITVGSVVDKIPASIPGIDAIEILVIDDGSTDQTQKVAEASGAEVYRFPHNQGLGLVFRKGIELALEKQADIIVNIDADGQFNPEDIPKLVMPILEGRAEFVTASRFLPKKYRLKMPLMKYLGNKLMSKIVSRVVGREFFDVSCGFRAYSREAALRLNLFGHYTYTQESFIDLAYKGISILEVSVKVKGEREHGKSKVASNLFKYGYHTMKIIIMAFRDYRPMRLMSYISFLFFLIGFGMGFFFLLHYIRVGAFRPHTWAAVGSGTMLLLSLFMLIVGVIMEMFSRMRLNQERLLYFARKDFYTHKEEVDRIPE